MARQPQLVMFGCSIAMVSLSQRFQLNSDGQFRFFAAPGAWTVRALVPGAIGEAKADADYGRAVDLTISL